MTDTTQKLLIGVAFAGLALIFMLAIFVLLPAGSNNNAEQPPATTVASVEKTEFELKSEAQVRDVFDRCISVSAIDRMLGELSYNPRWTNLAVLNCFRLLRDAQKFYGLDSFWEKEGKIKLVDSLHREYERVLQEPMTSHPRPLRLKLIIYYYELKFLSDKSIDYGLVKKNVDAGVAEIKNLLANAKSKTKKHEIKELICDDISYGKSRGMEDLQTAWKVFGCK